MICSAGKSVFLRMGTPDHCNIQGENYDAQNWISEFQILRSRPKCFRTMMISPACLYVYGCPSAVHLLVEEQT